MQRVAHGQRLGRRERQEDALRVSTDDAESAEGELFLLLADGMGGHAGGEVASALAIEAFATHFQDVSTNMRPRGRLREAMDAANTAIAQRIVQEPDLKGMGSTLIGALIVEGRLIWTSVGDSLLLLLRGGEIRRINADHSYMGELRKLIDAGEMTEAEAKAHPQRNVLISALIGEPLKLVDVGSMPLEPGDTILLASDGLETLEMADIADISQARQDGGSQPVVDALLSAVDARDMPRQDNVSLIVVRQPGQSVAASAVPPARSAPARASLTDLGAKLSPRTLIVAGIVGLALITGLVVGAMIRPEPSEPEMAETTETSDTAAPSVSTGTDDGIHDAGSGAQPIGDDSISEAPFSTAEGALADPQGLEPEVYQSQGIPAYEAWAPDPGTETPDLKSLAGPARAETTSGPSEGSGG